VPCDRRGRQESADSRVVSRISADYIGDFLADW
jgi:hypothetical protein